jgi:hypothetical protein
MSKALLNTGALVLAIAPVAVYALALGQTPQKTIKPAAQAISAENIKFFNNEVRPVLLANCINCHSGTSPKADFKLTSRASLLKGGVSGPEILTDKPDDSRLLSAINYKGPQMPPSGKLPQKTIDVLTKWVKMGAPWPAGEHAEIEPPHAAGPPKVTPEAMKFWSFQPVQRPSIPAVRQKAWASNPIDAFVLNRLEKEGLAPNPPATKNALIRRAYYDLIGLPPSPAEIQAFLADNSPQAYEKMVDRLLASPQYGEKWGRHWLDLVRFAETNSYERDGQKPNAWRYRDYVIRSFNQDKPYDQFITEQLAGDEINPKVPDNIIATGYYRLGIWDDEPSDPDQALYDDLDDISSTTGQVYLGLTINCARCHDHKLDPIPQKDYYRFLAFFNGLHRYGGHSQRSIGTEEEQQKEKQAVADHQLKIKQNVDQIDAVEKRLLPSLSPVEKEEFAHEENRENTLKKHIPDLISQADFDNYVRLRARQKSLFFRQPAALNAALCVEEIGPTARETHILMRGNPHVPGDKVEPGFPSVLSPPEPEIKAPEQGASSGRRLALARWIASKNNPLTARVMVNRMWQYHFGRGIVRTSSNFGFQGSKPTHPELLDWLSSELVSNGWKLKPIHKLILMSSTYRMSAEANKTALARDPENDFMWRYDMRRLQAEEIRDSILAANGSLNLQMGGPSFYPEIPAEVLAGQSQPGAGWGKSTPEQQARRSVYIYVKRSLITPIIASFDGPETDFTCPSRFATTQPTQALGMINSKFINDQAKVFATYLKKQAGAKPADQVKLALWKTMQREPQVIEIARGVNYVLRLQVEDHVSADDALASFCVIALNLNEFAYLD